MAETKRTVKLDILTTGFKVAEQDLTKLGRALKEAGNAAKGGGLSNALGGLNKSFMGAGITGDAGLIGLLRGGGAAERMRRVMARQHARATGLVD